MYEVNLAEVDKLTPADMRIIAAAIKIVKAKKGRLDSVVNLPLHEMRKTFTYTLIHGNDDFRALRHKMKNEPKFKAEITKEFAGVFGSFFTAGMLKILA